MYQAYGSRSEYLDAPIRDVQEQKLVWLAENKALNEQRQKELDAMNAK